ncbi:MFS transporter [Goodfellowiella coeruleoviolacea]|uniref:Arabinose efflux permease, MFS family n=1 Tax=Goodfellowiella coeruleoviolacea TaxID=334858 RepID=A0AAE3KJ17_9PSEU|nr:MFS transporter [Goodfellowiella coeruleoviolacea]MCP2163853.1 putative arabinose efflux permease, MFS family [Goodfellowiella coeruleoviolacea]
MTGTARRAALLAPLRHPDFRWLAVGSTATRLANSLAPIVLAFAVLDRTGSQVDLGIVVGARSVANVAVLLFGGVLADRLPRQVVLGCSSLAAALVQAVVAAGVLSGWASIPVLIALSVVNGALSAIALPASAALTSQTVPAALLGPANALMRMGISASMATGASLGGLLVAFAGPGWGLVGNALAFALASACFFRVRLARRAAPAAAHPGLLTDLREGWTEFTSRRWVWIVALQFTAVNAAVAGGLQVLGPGIADHTIGRSAWGLVVAAQLVGELVGGVLVARSRRRRMLLVGVALTVFDALPLLALAYSPQLAVLAVAMFLNGVALEQFGVAWDVSLQENVPADRLSRVYAYDALASFLAIPLGEIAVAPVAQRLGETTTLAIAAGLVLVATAGALCSRQVRGLVRRRDQAEPAATPATAASAGSVVDAARPAAGSAG